MGGRSAQSALLAGTVAALSLATLLLDLLTPLGVATAVLYVAPMLLALWLPWRWALLQAAALATVLTILGVFLSPPGGIPWMIAANRSFALLAIWSIALVGMLRNSTTNRLKHAVQMLEQETHARKQAEEGAKELATQYGAVLGNAGDGIAITVDGKLEYVNRAYLDIYGLGDPSQVLGTELVDTVLPKYRAILQGRIAARLAGLPIPNRYEYEVQRRDGEIRVLQLSGATVTYNGKPAVVGLYRDVTDLRRAEEALKEQEEHYRVVVENATDGIAVVVDGKLAFFNTAYLQMYGRSDPSQMLGIKPETLALPQYQEEIRQRAAARERGELIPQKFEYQVQQPGGEVRTLQVSGATITYSGKPAALGFVRDITEQRKAEERLAAANRELEAFAYSVSHDLRAPLRAIDGFSRIVMEEYTAGLSPEAQRYLGLVRSNTVKMGRLVDDLLAFSRLGRQSLQRQDVDMGKLVGQVLADLRNEQQGRQLDVAILDVPACRGDPSLLRQALFNLTSNALKFTRKLDNARVEFGALAQDGETVYYVKDNGVGFDMRYSDKLFGVFQRLHREEEYEGTGVGLAIVQRVIQRHGGRVWAEAEVNKGATFYFTLGDEHDYNR